MKTTEQLINEITALMADVWLSACNRRVIAPDMNPKLCMVIDIQVPHTYSARLPAMNAAYLSTGQLRSTS